MIRGGYARKILRVDLGTGEIRKDDLPEEKVLRQYIGGTGLALYYLLKETPAGAGATDPHTPLIFMTGPLAGTAAPSSSNYVVVSLHYETPYAAGTAHSHGFWAAYLKHAGYEGIIVTGRAAAPVYLWIDDGAVQLRDAGGVWGKDTRETERRIKAELGGEPDKISVACIGPAGKGSPGAIMGSKMLKAIAVRGTGTVPIAEPDSFFQTATQWERNLFVTPEGGVPPVLALVHDAGITRGYNVVGDLSMLAGKNLTDPEWGKVYGRNYVDGCAR
jgi:aldehyde:ferredoxin oxidoreductase